LCAKEDASPAAALSSDYGATRHGETICHERSCSSAQSGLLSAWQELHGFGIAENRFGMDLRIANDIRHARLLPDDVNVRMARGATGRPDESLFGGTGGR